MLPPALDRRRGSMRVAPLMPAAWLLLVAISATAQPAERPAPQLPAGLAPAIRIHDGDTSIEVQCSVRDSIGGRGPAGGVGAPVLSSGPSPLRLPRRAAEG